MSAVIEPVNELSLTKESENEPLLSQELENESKMIDEGKINIKKRKAESERDKSEEEKKIKVHFENQKKQRAKLKETYEKARKIMNDYQNEIEKYHLDEVKSILKIMVDKGLISYDEKSEDIHNWCDGEKAMITIYNLKFIQPLPGFPELVVPGDLSVMTGSVGFRFVIRRMKTMRKISIDDLPYLWELLHGAMDDWITHQRSLEYKNLSNYIGDESRPDYEL